MKTIIAIAVACASMIIIILGFKKNESMVNTVDVGVIVSNMQRSLTFYTNVLGMEQTGTWHASDEMATSYGVNSGKAFDIIDMKLDCNGYVLKYKLNNTPANSPANTINDSTKNSEHEYYGFEKPGTGYLTINVKNVDPFIKRIKENNVKYKLVTIPDGQRVILLHDPDGTLFEITGK